MITLNYHHLRYFFEVATEGNLTRAAKRLRVSQSALSTQIKQLEDTLDQPLFLRKGRSLELTEAGHIAMNYARDIFGLGDEFVSLLDGGRESGAALRVGAVATLSRNFQESFLQPLFHNPSTHLKIVSGGLQELLTQLLEHELDLVLSNRPIRKALHDGLRCRRVARQPVSLVGRPRKKAFRFPEDVDGIRLVLPSTNSDIRTAFDTLCADLGVSIGVLAEVDDMAMLRLLARDANTVSLIPSVVVRDEILSGRLQEYCEVPNLHENFYALTLQRRYQHPLLTSLLSRGEDEILGM